ARNAVEGDTARIRSKSAAANCHERSVLPGSRRNAGDREMLGCDGELHSVACDPVGTKRESHGTGRGILRNDGCHVVCVPRGGACGSSVKLDYTRSLTCAEAGAD